MTDKLEALSQPAAYQVKGCLCHTIEEAEIYVGQPEPLYSQEYVTALLAALEEKDQRIAELAVTQMTGPLSLVLKRAAELERIIEGVDQLAIDGGWTARGMSEYAKSLETRNAELQQRLQQPIKLPDYDTNDYGYKSLSNDEVVAALKEQGYQVEGE